MNSKRLLDFATWVIVLVLAFILGKHTAHAIARNDYKERYEKTRQLVIEGRENISTNILKNLPH